MNQRTIILFGLAVTVFYGPQIVTSQPHVPGSSIVQYASVTDPQRLDFDAVGAIFAGRDNQGSGGGPSDPVRIHRIAPGGNSVMEYGNSPIVDPDAVVVDTNGFFGVPGAVLVGGQVSNSMGGQIVSILPGGGVVPLFGPTPIFHNPGDMVFDNAGRFLFTNFRVTGNSIRGVYCSTGVADPPTLLFETNQPAGGIAIGPNDRIYVSTGAGVIEVHESDGSLIDGNFVTDLGNATLLAIGAFGTSEISLFTINTSGDLLRIDLVGGNTKLMGTGFDAVTDLVLGPAGDFYVAEFDNDRILKVEFVFLPGDVNGDLQVNLLDVGPFINAISMGIYIPAGDINEDGALNLLDVDPFIEILAGQ